jgi:hypothetical protein
MITRPRHPIFTTTELENRSKSFAANSKTANQADPTFSSLTNRTNGEIMTLRDEILKNLDPTLVYDHEFFSGCFTMNQTIDSRFQNSPKRKWKTPKKELPSVALILKPKS